MKVLIAEDDSITRKIVGRTVEKLGHEIVSASNGAEAWNEFQGDDGIEVVLSDWMMPGMNGLELCRRIRQAERPDYTYFILLTSRGSREHLVEGMRAGADEYLTKPLNGEQLKAKLLDAARVASARQRLDFDREENDAAAANSGSSNGVRSGSNNGDAAGNRVASNGGGSAGGLQSKARAGARGGNVWDILVAQGKLNESQLQDAIAAQEKDPRELGKVLVSLGFISETDLAQAQAQRMGLGYADLSEEEMDRGTVALVDQKVLRRHGVLPLRVEDGFLTLAMSDPTNLYALDDLKIISGYPIRPVVATGTQIRKTLNSLFAVGSQVSEILEEAAAGDVEAEGPEEIELGVDGGSEEAPIIRLVGSILQQAVAESASDIHIEPRADELAVRLRVDGVLRGAMSIPPRLKNGVIARLKILGSLDIAERRIPQDGRFSVRLGGQKIDFRVASLPTIFGEKIVLRLMDSSSVEADLTKLGFAPEIFEKYREVFNRPYGTILVTGPTGSGKSTTLYATLAELNSPEKNIITVEDPVEMRISGVNQMQVNPKAGLTFAKGLRSILRSDPDIVMIGEIRDFETAKISVEAALTGHLVLATLHTNNAPGALNRLTDMGVETFLTSSAVDCVIAQRLARKLCERCKEPVEMEEEVLAEMGFPFEYVSKDNLRFHKAVGCSRCGESGYRGRIGIYEMMVVDEAIRELILKHSSTAEISRAAESQGMIRLREDGLLKAARGTTTIEEVLRTVL